MDITHRWKKTGDGVSLQQEEEKLVLSKEQEKEIAGWLSRENRARYKIELYFSHRKSMFRAVPGVICFWESASKFLGGGDSRLQLCPGKSIGRNECERILPEQASDSRIIVCSNCHVAWKSRETIGDVFANLDLPQWAEVLEYYYRMLDYNADVYIKEPKEDLRVVTGKEMERDRGGDFMDKYNETLEYNTFMYPLKNIIKDTSNGSSLVSRFKSFITV